mgnify:FL=1
MRKINNKYLGNFYIEELENREEQDRVKLFDSDENYLDYLPLERYDDTDPTLEEQYDEYVKVLEGFKTVPDLMDWLVCDCGFIGNKSEAIKYVLTEWNLPDEECDPLDGEWVNRIGDVYIVVSEY